MAEPMYFQWQNEILLKTIYPLSAVGVFKHDLDNLMFNGGEETYNGSFVGFLPEGNVPAGDLEEMLDWNRILRRQVMTPLSWRPIERNIFEDRRVR